MQTHCIHLSPPPSSHLKIGVFQPTVVFIGFFEATPPPPLLPPLSVRLSPAAKLLSFCFSSFRQPEFISVNAEKVNSVKGPIMRQCTV